MNTITDTTLHAHASLSGGSILEIAFIIIGSFMMLIAAVTFWQSIVIQHAGRWGYLQTAGVCFFVGAFAFIGVAVVETDTKPPAKQTAAVQYHDTSLRTTGD